MRTSTTCGRSSAPKAIASRRSAASGTVSTMPDGALAPGTGCLADQRALAVDGRLIRGVRWRLVLWSGLTTLVVLAILGAALYAVAARTLETNGVEQVTNRLGQIVESPGRPGIRPSPEYGFIFGGNSSGTFAMAVDAEGTNLGRPGPLPAGLPVADGITAAANANDGRDLRLASVSTGDGEGGVAVLPRSVLARAA